MFEDGPARLGGGEEKEKEAAPQGPPDSCPLAPPPKALNLIDGIPPPGEKKGGSAAGDVYTLCILLQVMHTTVMHIAEEPITPARHLGLVI